MAAYINVTRPAPVSPRALLYHEIDTNSDMIGPWAGNSFDLSCLRSLEGLATARRQRADESQTPVRGDPLKGISGVGLSSRGGQAVSLGSHMKASLMGGAASSLCYAGVRNDSSPLLTTRRLDLQVGIPGMSASLSRLPRMGSPLMSPRW